MQGHSSDKIRQLHIYMIFSNIPFEVVDCRKEDVPSLNNDPEFLKLLSEFLKLLSECRVTSTVTVSR